MRTAKPGCRQISGMENFTFGGDILVDGRGRMEGQGHGLPREQGEQIPEKMNFKKIVEI